MSDRRSLERPLHGAGIPSAGADAAEKSDPSHDDGAARPPDRTVTPTVGAYYYPWYGKNFHGGGGYLRKGLDPPQRPALGEYDDTTLPVIGRHLDWSRRANIRLWVTSWWGPRRIEDTTTLGAILGHPAIGDLKVALHYETTNRIKDAACVPNARTDVRYMCEHYFCHPSYYKIDGRPVLVIYLSRKLYRDGLLESALLLMRSEASRHGHNLYVIGDQAFQKAPDTSTAPYRPFWYLDAVTNYDVYGCNGRPENGYAGKGRVDKTHAEQEKWRALALAEGCGYVPSVSPGYNDRAVRLQNDHPPLSRRLTPDGKEGSLFGYQLQRAVPLVDHRFSDGLILVNSFNEWHEDTQIEPATAVGGGGEDGPSESTSQPFFLTKGLEYTAYGELYLNILASATTAATGRQLPPQDGRPTAASSGARESG
jgi:glycoprotein endo-alpha-1,2-mannosidase